MPELAEVAFYARQWAVALGQPVLRVHVHAHARVFRETSASALAYPQALVGTTYAGAETHGKQMLFRWHGAEPAWLGGHLGMTGEIRVEPPDFLPTKHDHLVIFQKQQALVFRDPRKFGALRLHVGPHSPDWWSGLPPSPLQETYTLAHLQAFLTRHGKMPLKPLLLDQEGFPGIGNWMADEILWKLKIHPATLAGTLSVAKQKSLHGTVVEVSRAAMAIIGKDWSDPPDTWLFNHRWKPGGHCPRCQHALERDSLRGRTACWCGKCQSPPKAKPTP